MANPEHLKIIKTGPNHWNQWREENPGIQPDLSLAELSEMNLRRANLSSANLSSANLFSANLYGADFSYTDCIGANFSNASLNSTNLSGTILFNANFNGANLNSANLCMAQLYKTDFSEADLSFVSFSHAIANEANFLKLILNNSIFADVDLSQVKGLETCIHRGPSSIDHRTLIKSGKLPEVFLKGCGFPDSFIDYLPSLLGSLNPIDFYSCFISHSVKDEKFAKQLHSDLQAAGIRCWYAPEDLKTGQKIRKEIHEAIRIHDKLLLVLSKNSIDSDWVEEEVETAIQQEASRRKNNQDDLVLFPIMLDDTIMESEVAWAEKVRTRHIADFRKWKNQDSREEVFKRLLRDLKNESNNDKPKE